MPDERTFEVSEVGLTLQAIQRLLSDPFLRQRRITIPVSIRYETTGPYSRRGLRLLRAKRVRVASTQRGNRIQLDGRLVHENGTTILQIIWDFDRNAGAGKEVSYESARALQPTSA